MNEAKTVKDASVVLAARMPPGWRQRFTQVQVRRAGRRADAILDLTGSDGAKGRLVVEIKSRLVPRAVAEVKAQLDAFSPDPGLVVAPFLSSSTRDRLRSVGLNFLDLTGNIRIVVSSPGLYIETEGATVDPTPIGESRRSLRGAKAGRIVRALCDFAPPLSVSDLALKAGVDVSYASRIVEWLAREALLQRQPRGPVQKVDKAALIRRWSDVYAVLKTNDAQGYLDPRGVENLVRRIGDGSIRQRYAFTGSVAANRIEPVAPARLAMLYVDDAAAAAAALNLRPTETGTNVMLLTPFDEVVFDRTWVADGLILVAPSQVAVDLLTSPGRAPSEAEAILSRLGEEK